MHQSLVAIRIKFVLIKSNVKILITKHRDGKEYERLAQNHG